MSARARPWLLKRERASGSTELGTRRRYRGALELSFAPADADEAVDRRAARLPGLWRLAQCVWRRQDDNRAARPPDPSLRNHRNRQRELALQTPRLSATPACPGGQTGTPNPRRSVAREGTARRARDPPGRSPGKPVPTPVKGPFSMPIRGPDCVPFDILPLRVAVEAVG